MDVLAVRSVSQCLVTWNLDCIKNLTTLLRLIIRHIPCLDEMLAVDKAPYTQESYIQKYIFNNRLESFISEQMVPLK